MVCCGVFAWSELRIFTTGGVETVVLMLLFILYLFLLWVGVELVRHLSGCSSWLVDLLIFSGLASAW